MEIIAHKLPLFKEDESLTNYLQTHLTEVKNGDIIVITSKIIALSEGRTVSNPTPDIKKAQAKIESEEIVETPWCLLTRRGNDWSANAGIDESNAQGKLILLPKNSQETAILIRQQLLKKFNFQQLGVIISDTRLVPLRIGTLGIALAWSGIEALIDYRGTKDLYGRELKMTQANIVHALASAAVLAMGEGSEQKPIALIRNAPVNFKETSGTISDLSVLPQDDLYAPLYQK